MSSGAAMIESAKFQNFKALRNVEITFDSRLTVLVGPNGSGKTSILQAIQILCRAGVLKKQIQGEFNDWIVNEVFSGHDTEAMQLGITETRGGKPPVGVLVRAQPKGKVWKPSEEPRVWDLSRFELRRDRTQVAVGLTQALESLDSSPARFIQLQPSELAKPSLTQQTPPVMLDNGAGLASRLGYLKLAEEDRYEEITREFCKLIPTVKKIRVNRAHMDSGFLGEALEFDLISRERVPAKAMSDGTLYLLGLLTILYSPDRPKTLLLDDIDHGLHPKAQMELIDVLRKVLTRFPDLQIIATSHSPFILNKLQWNEVRVTGLGNDGFAICAKLEDHPDVARWREAMTPGEFWSSAGDDWVKKLKPTESQNLQPTTAP